MSKLSFLYKIWPTVYIKKQKVGSPRKNDLPFWITIFEIYLQTPRRDFSGLESSISLSISKLFFTNTASYNNNFHMRKHKIASFETPSTTAMSYFFSFLGWANLLSTVMVPTK